MIGKVKSLSASISETYMSLYKVLNYKRFAQKYNFNLHICYLYKSTSQHLIPLWTKQNFLIYLRLFYI